MHLRRRHQAASVSTSQEGSAYGGRPRYRFKPGDGRSFDFNSFSRSDGRWANINGDRNPLDDTIDNLRRIAEIKRLTEEVNPHNQQHPSFMPPIDYVSINYTEEFLKKLDSMTFTPETDPLRDRIIGYRCHICEICVLTNPMPLYGFRESSTIVPSHHRCNPHRVANLQGLTGLDRRSKVMELYRSSTEAMMRAVHDWWLDGVSPHLIVVPLITAGNDAYEFTPQLLEDYRWLSIAIEEEEITLDDNYLKEFMLFTRGNTFIKFSIREANTSLRVSSYFMTLSKGPFLPFKFTIDNSESQL